MLRKCDQCGKEKELNNENFSFRENNVFHKKCKVCTNLNAKEYREKK